MKSKLLLTTTPTIFPFGANFVTVELTSPGLLKEKQENHIKSTIPEFNSISKVSNPLVSHFTIYNFKDIKNEEIECATLEMPGHLFPVINANYQCIDEVISDGSKKVTGIRNSVYKSNVTRSAQC